MDKKIEIRSTKFETSPAKAGFKMQNDLNPTDCHCERSPEPNRVQGGVKQSHESAALARPKRFSAQARRFAPRNDNLFAWILDLLALLSMEVSCSFSFWVRIWKRWNLTCDYLTG